MGYLQHKLDSKELEGIKIFEELTIYHRLFADDVGIFIPADKACFKKLQEALKIYELVSRAKLNLAKSMIVPLAMMEIPQWLQETRCMISKPGEV